jgi:hypothetical protein
MKADLVVYDRSGQIILIAEIKKKKGVSAEWAAKWRRNMISHGALPDAKFFMIALPERFYLWKNAGNMAKLDAPTFEIDAEPVLKPYLDESGISSEDITPQSFELIVTSWLNSILMAGEALNFGKDTSNLIKKSGLSEALNGGNLKHEVVL